MTKKQFINEFIKGHRMDNMTYFFLNTSSKSHKKFQKELDSKANERRNNNKDDN